MNFPAGDYSGMFYELFLLLFNILLRKKYIVWGIFVLKLQGSSWFFYRLHDYQKRLVKIMIILYRKETLSKNCTDYPEHPNDVQSICSSITQRDFITAKKTESVSLETVLLIKYYWSKGSSL